MLKKVGMFFLFIFFTIYWSHSGLAVTFDDSDLEGTWYGHGITSAPMDSWFYESSTVVV
jgi:hypothetical protein